jgi:hypothetical protein
VPLAGQALGALAPRAAEARRLGHPVTILHAQQASKASKRGLAPQPVKGQAQAWPAGYPQPSSIAFRAGRVIPLPAVQPLTVFPAHRRSGSQRLHVQPLETKGEEQ